MEEKKPVRSVLFVCTGNTCRSVMAEGFLKDMLPNDKHIEVSSAGLIPYWSGKANEMTIEVMADDGIDVAAHRTKGIDERLLNKIDLVLTMTKQQRDSILAQFKVAQGKTFCFKEYVYQEKEPERLDIQDPFGGTKEEYLKVAAEIKNIMQDLVKIL